MAKETTIKLVKGAGLVSVQVFTGSLKGRPFPAFSVLCNIKDDGTILNCNNPAFKALRAEIISKIR